MVVTTYLLFVFSLIMGLLSPIISFAVQWLVAKFIIAPLIGAQICFALNTVFSTDVFTLEFFPLCYATAALVGSLLFKPRSHTSSKVKE